MDASLTSTMARAAALLVFASMLATGCGDDDPAAPPYEDDTGLVFTREDGSVIAFSSNARVYVWCGAWEEGPIDTLTVHVWCSTCDPGNPHAGWLLRAVRAEIVIGDTLRFPNAFIWNQPHGADFFLFDPPNELSTSDEESTGWIVFHRLPCDDGGAVEFSMNALLGSEYADLRPVAVTGRCRAGATGIPPCFN